MVKTGCVFLAAAASILLSAAANQPSESALAGGQKLAAELRSMTPAKDLQVHGILKIRKHDGKRTRVPFGYRIIIGDGHWQSIYETQPSDTIPGERLVVVHAEGRPNRYLHSRLAGSERAWAEPAALSGGEAMVPFAGSDFWLADLGLEFLHWPQQRLVEEARIRMRKGRPCKVLESVNPASNAAGYTRVRSWIDTESGGIILAEAYGSDGKLMKAFEIGGMTKVNDNWELKSMEMWSAPTDSLSLLEFKYGQEP